MTNRMEKNGLHVAKELVDFMKITDFRISPGAEEARKLQKKVAELKKD